MDPKEMAKAFEDFKAAQKATDENIRAMLKAQDEGNKDAMKKAMDAAEASAKQVQVLADKIVALEQKLVNKIMTGSEAPKSYAQIIVEDPAYKAFASGQTNKCRITLKDGFKNAITGQGGSPATADGVIVAPDRRQGIISGANLSLRAKDLIATGNTNSDAVKFTRELLFTNNAKEVKQGGARQESAITFEPYTANVVTIGHFIKVSREVLNDAPALQAYIEARLRYGVELREDAQILAGDGADQNLTGMTVSPNFTAFVPTTGETEIDSANRAIRALDAVGYPANGIIMNPATWGSIERMKDENKNYLVGSPFGAIIPTLWGKPVALSPNVPADKLLVGAFNVAFMYLTRQEVVIEMSESDGDNFQKGLVTIRAEKRGTLGGLLPSAVRYGALKV